MSILKLRAVAMLVSPAAPLLIFVGIAFGILVLVVGKYLLLDTSYFLKATTLCIFFIAERTEC